MVPDRVEWTTVIVAASIATGFAAVLAAHERLPVGAELILLAVLGAWYNSLQHEVIHGHPTPWPAINTALAAVPLGLVLPLSLYRRTHLAHHRSPLLTDPELDPESFQVTPAAWARYGRVRRGVLRAMRTLAGRLVLGPPVAAARAWTNGRPSARQALVHVAAVAMILLAVRASGLPVWVFVVGVAWGGGALSLLRSFAEHRVPDDGSPSAVVRSGRLMSLLFLNNNLHHTHHARPGVPWFELPALHEVIDGDRAAAAGAGLYDGYGDVIRRYLVRPFGTPVA
jgi:fatty acid desaturase